MARVTVIGYGNPLRGDDGAGWYLARRLIEKAGDGGPPDRPWPGLDQALGGAACAVEVLALQQLTPEVAESISHSELVIFLDASCTLLPGQWACEEVRPRPGPPGPTTHHFAPAALLALAGALSGTCPQRGILLTIGGESFAYGEGLSPVVTKALAELEEVVTGWIRSCG